MHPFWLSCVEDFKRELSQHQFTTWIKPLSFLQDGDNFTLLAPNRFVLQWAKDRILARVEQAGEKYFARPCSIELALLEGPALSEPTSDEREDISRAPGALTNPPATYAASAEGAGASVSATSLWNS